MALLRLLTLIFFLSLPGAALLSLPLGLWGFVIALFFSAAIIFFHIFFHSSKVLSVHGAKPVEAYSLAIGGAGALGLKPLVRRVAFKLGVPEPQVWMYADADARIFSVGSRYGQIMVISSGLLSILGADELEAIVTRELLRFSHSRARWQPLYAALGCSFGRLLQPRPQGWVIPRIFLLIFLLPFLAVLAGMLRPRASMLLMFDEEAARVLTGSAPLAAALYKIAHQSEHGSSLPLTVRLACGALYPVPPAEVGPWIHGLSLGFMELDFHQRIGRLMGWTVNSHV